jgi:hypothetical protein
MNRTNGLALAAGIAAGVAIGILYAWVVSPVEYVDTAPSSLRANYRQDYLALIAQAYASTGDLDRAEARLALFQLDEPADELAALAQERLAGRGDEDARALAALAADLGERPAPLVTRPPTAVATATPRPTSQPRRTATPTRRPSQTPTISATLGPPFALADRQQACASPDFPPQIRVEVEDAAGDPVPGLEVVVLSDLGQDHFFTGLKPELGLGYGDFEMDPEQVYTVQLEGSDQPVTNVGSSDCETDEGETYPGSILLVFEQPSR